MSSAVKLPGNLETNRRLSQWLTLNDDRTVTVRTGKIEIGQGIVTALAQIAAEELDVSLSRVRMVGVDTLSAPNEGHTSASRSTDDSGSAIRHACAEARALLVEAAAARLDIPADQLTVEDGVISGYDRIREVSYWDLPHAEILDREATAAVMPKPSAQLRVVGTNAARIDIPAKVVGLPRFVHDVEVPGMLFGRVVRGPTIGAKLLEFDAAAVQALPGVVAAFSDGGFIGVVAEREEQAVKARQAAIRIAKWQQNPLPTDSHGIYDYLTSRKSPEHVLLDKAPEGIENKTAVRTLSARYTKPYLAHAALGPSCALARITEGMIEVWTHSQGVYPLRNDLAAVLEVMPKDIVIHHVEGAGC